MNNELDFTYLIQPPKRYTFQQSDLKRYVESQCKGRTLNLFAGKTILNCDEVRVDINPEMPADYHCDALQFISRWNSSDFDTVILDPPYNVRKSREKYDIGANRYYKGKLTIIKDALLGIISPGARVISLGYDSVGMSAHRGFKKIAIALVCHNGDHNDTICLTEKMVSEQKTLRMKEA